MHVRLWVGLSGLAKVITFANLLFAAVFFAMMTVFQL